MRQGVLLLSLVLTFGATVAPFPSAAGAAGVGEGPPEGPRACAGIRVDAPAPDEPVAGKEGASVAPKVRRLQPLIRCRKAADLHIMYKICRYI